MVIRTVAMKSNRGPQVEQLYLSELAREPNQRGAFLAEAYEGDGQDNQGDVS